MELPALDLGPGHDLHDCEILGWRAGGGLPARGESAWDALSSSPSHAHSPLPPLSINK